MESYENDDVNEGIIMNVQKDIQSTEDKDRDISTELNVNINKVTQVLTITESNELNTKQINDNTISGTGTNFIIKSDNDNDTDTNTNTMTLTLTDKIENIDNNINNTSENENVNENVNEKRIHAIEENKEEQKADALLKLTITNGKVRRILGTVLGIQSWPFGSKKEPACPDPTNLLVRIISIEEMY